MPPPVSKVLMSVAFWADKFAKPINETRLTQEVRRNVEQEDGDMFGLGGGTPDETLGWFFCGGIHHTGMRSWNTSACIHIFIIFIPSGDAGEAVWLFWVPRSRQDLDVTPTAMVRRSKAANFRARLENMVETAFSEEVGSRHAAGWRRLPVPIGAFRPR